MPSVFAGALSGSALTAGGAKGEPILWSDIELPESDLLAAWRRQEELLAGFASTAAE